MNRRTFIATTGLGAGIAGCVTDSDGSDGGSEPTGSDDTDDSSTDDDPAGDEGADADSGPSVDDGSDTDASGADDAESETSTETSDDADSADDPGDEEPAEETDAAGREIAFDSCRRATVTGHFADRDVAFANTGFYEDGLFGNTILEDGVVFGDDVAAPFSGTVVFEVGDESTVTEGEDGIVVEVPDYGSDGTVIESLTTERADYERVSPTRGNPHAVDCLEAIDSDGSAAGPDEPTFDVSILGTNTPVDAGAFLEVYVELENTGGDEGDGEVVLVVGHDPEQVASRSVTLAPGERTTLGLGYETPPVDSDQEVPVRVEVDDAVDTRSVLVFGTG